MTCGRMTILCRPACFLRPGLCGQRRRLARVVWTALAQHGRQERAEVAGFGGLHGGE